MNIKDQFIAEKPKSALIQKLSTTNDKDYKSDDPKTENEQTVKESIKESENRRIKLEAKLEQYDELSMFPNVVEETVFNARKMIHDIIIPMLRDEISKEMNDLITTSSIKKRYKTIEEAELAYKEMEQYSITSPITNTKSGIYS